MRKIKKFSVNENAFVLSPEEMRMISGGGSVKCREGGCRVYIYSPSDPTKVVKYEDGYCAPHNNSCECYASGNYYSASDGRPNACILS